MKSLLIILVAMLGLASLTLQAQAQNPVQKTRKEQLSIAYPKNNQKVRGPYKVSGTAKPGTVVKVHISSAYFKIVYDRQQRKSKGAGPIARMNRTYTATTDRAGRWAITGIELWNAGWEETYTINATANGASAEIKVYDNTLPVNID